MFDARIQSERTDLLVRALLALENEDECSRFLEDLFTIREIRDLSQRLEVAVMLRRKCTYSEIVEKTGVSTATIGRVNRALLYGANGYNLILDKLNGEKNDRPE